MAEKEIKITFAGEKLEALSFFLAEQGGRAISINLMRKMFLHRSENLWRAEWKLYRRQQIRSRNPREREAQDSREHPADGAGRHRIRKGSRESRCRKPWKRQQKIR